MPHVPGHPEDGCPKCIINRPLIATAALRLAAVAGDGDALSEIHDAAAELASAAADAAKLHDDLVVMGLADLPKHDEWEGCEEAATIMSWVAAIDAGTTVPSSAAKTLRAWTRDMHLSMLNLASGGKVPR